jgi:hypothetical protein
MSNFQNIEMNHDELMQMDARKMSDTQVDQAINGLRSDIVPCLEATMQNPMVIAFYKARLADLMVEATARRVANNKAVRV